MVKRSVEGSRTRKVPPQKKFGMYGSSLAAIPYETWMLYQGSLEEASLLRRITNMWEGKDH